MEQYIYNLGLEAGKLMNALHSINKSNAALHSFLSGNNLPLESKLIYPVKKADPKQFADVTGPLYVQGSVAKSWDSNTYLGTTGSSETPSQLVPQNNLRFVKMNQIITGSSLLLRNQYVYEVFGNYSMDEFKPNFYLNTTNYRDSHNIVFYSHITQRNEKRYDFIGYSAESYNTHYGQTSFGSILENQLEISKNVFNSLESALNSAFESLALECSSYANVSYTANDVISQMGDSSQDVKDSFKEFASIDLNV
jgi:hypothetical protein